MLILLVTGLKSTTLHKTNNISNSISKRLSVQVSLTGLSFLIQQGSSSETLFFYEKEFSNSRTPEELLFEINKIVKQKEELGVSFDEVSVVYATDCYTLVPSSLFDPEKAVEYLKFNTKILGNDFIAHDKVTLGDLIVVYVPFVNINNYFFERFGTFQYYHATSILLECILKKERHSILPKIFLHVQKEHFDCIIIKNGQLELCNSYPFRTTEDFIYYVLFAMEQLQLSTENTQAYIFGKITRDDNLYTALYTYIRNIEFFKDNRTTPSETNLEDHQHYLIHQVLS